MGWLVKWLLKYLAFFKKALSKKQIKTIGLISAGFILGSVVMLSLVVLVVNFTITLPDISPYYANQFPYLTKLQSYYNDTEKSKNLKNNLDSILISWHEKMAEQNKLLNVEIPLDGRVNSLDYGCAKDKTVYNPRCIREYQYEKKFKDLQKFELQYSVVTNVTGDGADLEYVANVTMQDKYEAGLVKKSTGKWQFKKFNGQYYISNIEFDLPCNIKNSSPLLKQFTHYFGIDRASVYNCSYENLYPDNGHIYKIEQAPIQ